MTRIKTNTARDRIGNTLDSLQIAKKLSDHQRERVFTFQVAQYLEALKRSHNSFECALASRLDRYVIARDYDAAIQVWEGRR
jgi:hypothetical protein